ncbi:MAG TPA: radical SAM protein [Candidatus Nitrosotenuis sp.]|nr:radical SAM protein [Candidatus Nitrosotenuis sp.]
MPVLKLIESCNLACSYCYQAGHLGPGRVMAFSTLERVLAEVGRISQGPLWLLWFGGEPTLVGLERFRQALEISARLLHDRPVYHGLQTNATLLDERWADLLAEHGFAVTVSLDGPAHLHDAGRPARRGGGSHAAAEAGVRALQARGLQPRASCVLTPVTLPHPELLVDYFADLGVPEVDFVPATRHAAGGLEVLVTAEQYGEFMVRALERWLALGRRGFRVRMLAALARRLSGLAPRYCKLEGSCSSYVSFAWNGDVYPCDEFFALPGHCLGNVLESPLDEILASPRATQIYSQWNSLPPDCRGCRWESVCGGGCPWERRLGGGLHQPSVLCQGLQRIYSHMQARLAPVPA